MSIEEDLMLQQPMLTNSTFSESGAVNILDQN
uniref:Uncharacterized protein n=1 Tax=Megaselia scalaris TaxID=36166 RepID=T1GWL9_MEGSC